ncbi:MAG TPA: hypothetical protein VGA62_00470, partial [Acidimicrobiia bacterium]
MATTITDPSLDPSQEPERADGPGSHQRGEPHVATTGAATTTGTARRQPRRADVVNMLIGRRIRTDQEMHERLGNSTALAVFASDALSSVAYATEEMLGVLLLGGAGSLAFGTLVPLSVG